MQNVIDKLHGYFYDLLCSIDSFEDLIKDWRATENEAVPPEGAINITPEEMKDFQKQANITS